MGLLLTVVSFLASSLAFILFFSGLMFAKMMIQSKSIKGAPFLQFLSGLFNCILFLYYAELKNDAVVYHTNMLGLIMSIIPLAVYTYYTTNKLWTVIEIVSCVALCFLFFYYLTIYVRDEVRVTDQLGVVITIASTMMTTAPLQLVFDAQKSKDATIISIPFTVLCMACGFLWFVYGMMVDDFYIYAPNIPGITVCCISLYTAYTL